VLCAQLQVTGPKHRQHSKRQLYCSTGFNRIKKKKKLRRQEPALTAAQRRQEPALTAAQRRQEPAWTAAQRRQEPAWTAAEAGPCLTLGGTPSCPGEHPGTRQGKQGPAGSPTGHRKLGLAGTRRRQQEQARAAARRRLRGPEWSAAQRRQPEPSTDAVRRFAPPTPGLGLRDLCPWGYEAPHKPNGSR